MIWETVVSQLIFLTQLLFYPWFEKLLYLLLEGLNWIELFCENYSYYISTQKIEAKLFLQYNHLTSVRKSNWWWCSLSTALHNCSKSLEFNDLALIKLIIFTASFKVSCDVSSIFLTTKASLWIQKWYQVMDSTFRICVISPGTFPDMAHTPSVLIPMYFYQSVPLDVINSFTLLNTSSDVVCIKEEMNSKSFKITISCSYLT